MFIDDGERDQVVFVEERRDFIAVARMHIQLAYQHGARQVDGDPGLAYAFAVSLVKTGSYDEGVRRLKSMEEANPKSADLHMMLGSAFADHSKKRFARAPCCQAANTFSLHQCVSRK